jgi:NAD(P)-dependent dehydrogenase (short-subunit alcohol dehydrogenase family)
MGAEAVDLKNKVALVTGGAHRVGKAITLELAQAGANLIVNYHTADEAAQQTVAEVESLGGKAVAVQCDVAELAAVQKMASVIQEHFGGVDVIVNSASHFAQTPFPSTDPAVLET